MAGPKGAYQARADEAEWDALNRGEAYYTQWKKNQFAARQTAQETARKQRAQRYRDDLLSSFNTSRRSLNDITIEDEDDMNDEAEALHIRRRSAPKKSKNVKSNAAIWDEAISQIKI